MRGGPTKPKYKIPKPIGTEYKQVVMIGAEKFVFDTKEEADAFTYFVKHGVDISLALEEVKRLKEKGELTPQDDTGLGGLGGTAPY